MKTPTLIFKSIGLVIFFILLFSSVSALSTVKTKEKLLDIPTNTVFTHTVFVEGCTATWCSPCSTSAAVMHDLFFSGDYDFYYVALVADKNPYADQRCQELGVQSIPDYVFDGGYTRWVGSSRLPSAYITRLESSGIRDVANIHLDLWVDWLDGDDYPVSLNIYNDQDTTYHGHIRMYATEIESRWKTKSGNPYHFAMIGDFLFNEDISIPAGEYSTHNMVWEGGDYGFEDIQNDNIMFIATVFRDDNKGFVDATVAKAFVDLWPSDLEVDFQPTFAGIKTTLKNIGYSTMTNLDWSIKASGGLFHTINVSTTGLIDRLAADEEIVMQTDQPVFGFGRISVVLKVNKGVAAKQGYIIGPLILFPDSTT